MVSSPAAHAVDHYPDLYVFCFVADEGQTYKLGFSLRKSWQMPQDRQQQRQPETRHKMFVKKQIKANILEQNGIDLVYKPSQLVFYLIV